MSKLAPPQFDVISTITTFGELLRYLRRRAQITQRELALAVGYSISQISRLEHNKRLPDEMTLLAIFVPALRLEHEPETVEQLLALARQARGGDVANSTEPSPETVPPGHPASPIAPKLTNLPHRLTSFIGRDDDVVALQHLVKAHRLVTLTGVGGVGKSSLALALASTLTFPDGVWLLELAPTTEGGLVARLLANLFQLPESPGRTPLEAVIACLQHKELLLIVDNCEHLISTCAELVDQLLRASSMLHILATSREVLNIAGEREWSVAPLLTPSQTATDDSAWSLLKLQSFAAAQLFIERAQEVNTDLCFTDQDAPLIADICHRLDGIPLALELAAARCKSIALQEIVARLHNRFVLLTSGKRTALLRHQTLRATIDWSYDLLSPAEAALFRRLSVFVGGWTIEAAEQMAVQEQSHPPTFDLVHQLVNKSLVVIYHRGETTRYHMLETIRQYASEKLQEQGEEAAVGEQHAVYFLQLAEQARPLLYSAQQSVWYQRLVVEQSNFRAALHWARTRNSYAQVAQLSAALCWFWWKHGDIREEVHWSEWALTEVNRHRATTSRAVCAKALYSVGFGADCLGDCTRARILFEEYLQIESQPSSFIDFYEVLRGLARILDMEGDFQQAQVMQERRLALSREYDFLNGVADALMHLGNRAQSQGELAKASQLLQESLSLHKSVGTVTGVAQTQTMLGVVASEQGDHAQALLLFHEVLELCRTLDDKHGLGWTFSELGVEAQLLQDYEKANHYQREALAVARELGYPHMVGLVLGRLGNVALLQNDPERARTYFLENLTVYQQITTKPSAAGLEGLAGVAALNGRPHDAAYLLGAAEARCQARGSRRAAEQEAIHEQTVAVARTALGEAQFEAAYITGQTTVPDDITTQTLGMMKSART